MQLRFQPPTDLLCESLSRSLASTPTTSPYFSSDEEEDTSFFGRKYVDSPASHSDYEDEEEANDSDATLDDVDLDKFGSPLERIPPCEGRDGAIALIAVDADHELVHEIIYHRGIPCSSDCPSPTLSSESSVTSSITDYHAIVDEFLNRPRDPFDGLNPQNFITYDPSPSSSSLYGETPLMVKRIPRESTELTLYLHLNSDQLRNDPWNPCPHLLRVVDHDPESESSYLFMERLNEYNTPPMTTVSHYLDFFRQALEGLSFLHEHGIVGFSCSDPSSFMADLSCGFRSRNSSSASLPHATTSQDKSQDATTSFTSPHLGRREDRFNQHDSLGVQLFDRSAYPVKYYFVDLTRARRVEEHPQEQKEPASPTKHQTHSHLSKRALQYKQDVKDLGLLFDCRLCDMPSVVSNKFKALVKSMTSGGFGAEDARKLFEALNRSLDSEVFDLPTRPGIGKRSASLKLAPRQCRGDFGLEPDRASLSS
ncbi:hypothetical protein AGABI1DRAFT_113058 [Agaricus bisporus var. burnettii JB137-S8]|uniref:Protein kinase domain-containing protein n=1 Tax=Agaricus bisporus var. burnettii (strain JB137-S8 / ATCC MYA-4627 / FGSC 10392) TaxID=597362 RepID=K5X966_AGABU|nr:uncharacterized protein AGABI1DRAFT_113058 [Agaricus bisporus var. burnettii JB137-S8]EKM79753.1 hypothetical protein AGABI1DRAFT_113058 [Agaricus bisporus var. burnettii JB137-S8]